MNFQRSANSANREGGFSLIEVAIALMVIGLLVSGILALYNIQMVRKKDVDTKASVQNIEAALNKYVIRHGRYPRPADRDKKVGEVGFGKEAASITDVCGTSNKACVTTGGGTVYIGDVPFATLGVRYTNAMDSYGRKLVYAVSVSLTSTGTFNENAGAINVRTLQNGNFYPGAPLAHYFIYSAGPDGEGAYTQNGALANACGTAATGTDFENCNNDAIFRSNIDMDVTHVDSYLKSVRTYAAGVSQFDDWTAYKNTTSVGLWTISASLNELISTNSGANLLVGAPTSCGTDCLDPPRTTVEVQGGVRATSLRTKRICGHGPNCTIGFTGKPINMTSPSHFAGTPDTSGADNGNGGRTAGGILCPGNRALRGFYNGDEACTISATVSNPANFNNGGTDGCNTASTGLYATGITAAGKVKCN